MSDGSRIIAGPGAGARPRPSAATPESPPVAMTSDASRPLASRRGVVEDGLLIDVRRAYLIGIGGVGMSGAAEILRARGHDVLGSDRNPPPGADRDDAPLPAQLDLVVHSAAIPPDHPQIQEARSRGIPVERYAGLLGALMADRIGICVAGCHGKTTTASLLASALLHAGRDPSFLIGGTLTGPGIGSRSGGGPLFVAESCEFDRSFHAHRPTVAIVTNVDEDHLDYYSGLAEIQESFRVFAALLPADGTLIVNDAYETLFRDDPRIRARIQSYGFGAHAWWRVGEPRLVDGGAATEFDLWERDEPRASLRIPLHGPYNVLNATAAAAAMAVCGVAFEQIVPALAAFEGVGRRQELVAERDGITILDDYGHHPVEIRAVIRSLRQRFDGRRLVIVFQPHQASRTRCLMQEFAVALAEADAVWLPPIFFARDSKEEQRAVTSEDLAAHVRNEGGNALTLPDLAAAVEYGGRHLRAGDVVVTMGAGNIDEVARGIADRLP